MKLRLQFTPALTAALIGAAVWFGFWLLAFRPAPAVPDPTAPPCPEVSRLPAGGETLRELKEPTLFALPSGKGFSGNLRETRVNLRLPAEKPASPARYLIYQKPAESGLDQKLLAARIALPKTALPAPGTDARPVNGSAVGTQIFFSPELKARADKTITLPATGAWSEPVRIILTVLPDGTVESAFFEKPATNAGLLSAVRQLQFKPAKEKTEGWMDIRFAQEEKP